MKLKKIKNYIPTGALVLFCVAVAAVIVNIISENSRVFSDFFNRYIASVIRAVPAMLTSIVPISLAETLIIFIPVLFVVIMVTCVRKTRRSTREGARFVVTMASVLTLLYSLFVFTTTVGYNGAPLGEKLGLETAPVSVDELSVSAWYMIDKMNDDIDAVSFTKSGASVMPYSYGKLNKLILQAYDKASDKYPFLPRLNSRFKIIALSEPMTHTHISGIFTYYTGEANININFPDYTLPFTVAHEFAHQRGVMHENEANFVAFLVCAESDDPYIRYSGYLNMYEYLNSALYSADYDRFSDIFGSLDDRAKGDIYAYNDFFEKYRESVAADVTGAMNDTYLKFQGVQEGVKSYGTVVDLAVAYVKDTFAK